MNIKGQKRGLPIGANTSQPLGNFASSPVDHYMKEKVRCKCYLRNCDDVLGLARTKGEAWNQLNEYYKKCEEYGFVIKSDVIVAPIATRRRDVTNKKKRKRQRGRRKIH